MEEQLTYIQAIIDLNLWKKGGMSGLHTEDVLKRLHLIENKIENWYPRDDTIDDLFLELGQVVLIEIRSILKRESLEKAINNRY